MKMWLFAVLLSLIAVAQCAEAGETKSFQQAPAPAAQLRILVLGGTGFVGSRFVRKAALRGHEVVAISRRGSPNGWGAIVGAVAQPRWISCDITNTTHFFQVLSSENSFDVYVHAAGVLFDASSGLSSLNPWMSGSGSEASANSYDAVTRQSAFALMDIALQKHQLSSAAAPPALLFISAAEAAWTFRTPLRWLEEYLAAKRHVEHRLFSLQGSLRPVLFRPSYIWNQDRVLSLASVLPLYWMHYFTDRVFGWKGFVDAPVAVGELVDAMLYGAEARDEIGIKKAKDMGEMSREMKERRRGTRVLVPSVTSTEAALSAGPTKTSTETESTSTTATSTTAADAAEL